MQIQCLCLCLCLIMSTLSTMLQQQGLQSANLQCSGNGGTGTQSLNWLDAILIEHDPFCSFWCRPSSQAIISIETTEFFGLRVWDLLRDGCQSGGSWAVVLVVLILPYWCFSFRSCSGLLLFIRNTVNTYDIWQMWHLENQSWFRFALDWYPHTCWIDFIRCLESASMLRLQPRRQWTYLSTQQSRPRNIDPRNHCGDSETSQDYANQMLCA